MKYQVTGNTKEVYDGKHLVTLYQIKAMKDIPKHGVKIGDIGGWIQDTSNLSHDGNSWIDKDSMVYGESVVKDDAIIKKSLITGKTEVSHNSSVISSQIKGKKSIIKDNAQLFMVKVFHQLKAEGNCFLQRLKVEGEAIIKSEDCSIADSTLRGNVTILSNKVTIKWSTLENLMFYSASEYTIIRSTIISSLPSDIHSSIAFSDVELHGVKLDFKPSIKSEWSNVKIEVTHRVVISDTNRLNGVLIKGIDFELQSRSKKGSVINGSYYPENEEKQRYSVVIDSGECKLDSVTIEGNVWIQGDWSIENSTINGMIHLHSDTYSASSLINCSLADCIEMHILKWVPGYHLVIKDKVFSGEVALETRHDFEPYNEYSI
ncbi:hypothetical protein JMA_38820 (plasmid) [Jeotgalibacillus malaysiensis]|uniref:Uncharacterized protein n=1 Tax=Jeotgalibacillus malaysiensis TaxID=1508404 RepID=A0A0B5ASK7_9BACL|nr:hypothetical protein [Jeotgalibacillus malaysiensis]AJD93200.1 hypothetical protein JMA_38820 [Jeotgalibacillus malaysiensis]